MCTIPVSGGQQADDLLAAAKVASSGGGGRVALKLMGHKDGNDASGEEEGKDTDLPQGTRCRLSPTTKGAWITCKKSLHNQQSAI